MILCGRLIIDPEQAPLRGWVAVQGEGIAEIGGGEPPGAPDAGDSETLICPGFIDAHVHLPQVDSVGCEAQDLLAWLEEIIYPAEAHWADPNHASGQIERALSRMLGAGTLGFAGHLTAHGANLALLRRSHAKRPLRAIVGQSLMDRNAPAKLIGHAPAPLPPATDRLAFSVNPRFAGACSEDLLAEAGRLTASGAFVQTHLAEQASECALVARLFPHAPHYTGVYDRFGLLGERTLLAHCLHLAAEEWRLIAERRSVVVHCPAANTFLQSGLFDLSAAHRHSVRLALGSDVAAGPDLAMPRVARAMIEVAKMRRMTIDPDAHVPTPAEAWRLITAGNAKALGFADAGRLEVGAAADLLLIRAPCPHDEHLIGRLIHTWRDAYITHRIVAGRVVKPTRDEP